MPEPIPRDRFDRPLGGPSYPNHDPNHREPLQTETQLRHLPPKSVKD